MLSTFKNTMYVLLWVMLMENKAKFSTNPGGKKEQ